MIERARLRQAPRLRKAAIKKGRWLIKVSRLREAATKRVDDWERHRERKNHAMWGEENGEEVFGLYIIFCQYSKNWSIQTGTADISINTKCMLYYTNLDISMKNTSHTDWCSTVMKTLVNTSYILTITSLTQVLSTGLVFFFIYLFILLVPSLCSLARPISFHSAILSSLL